MAFGFMAVLLVRGIGVLAFLATKLFGAHRFIEVHGGRIDVTSEPRVGTTLTILATVLRTWAN